jgi:hypothetical protein
MNSKFRILNLPPQSDVKAGERSEWRRGMGRVNKDEGGMMKDERSYVNCSRS